MVDVRWTQTKVLSSIHTALERKSEHYFSRPECSAFLDDGFSFETHADQITDWLEFTYSDRATVWARNQDFNVFVCST